MGTLYDLTVEYESLVRDIMEAENGEEIAALTDRLDQIDTEWTVKAGNLARVMRELLLSAEAAKKEAARLSARANNCETGAKRIKEIMTVCMKEMGIRKADTDIGRWSLRNNPPSVEIIDEAKIPAEYLIEQKPVVNKLAIRDAYKRDGELIPGTEIRQTESLQFR